MGLSLNDQQWRNITFIAALCERHAGNFTLWADVSDKAQDGEEYRRCLNKMWEALAGQLKSEKNLAKALEQAESLQPQPQDDDAYGIYPATDACLLLISGLQMLLDESIDDSSTAANLSLATVTQFLEFTGEAPEAHELLVNERDFQNELLERLNTASDRAETIKRLRHQLADYETSNLGISIN